MREDSFRRNFGRRARAAREAKGLTQRAVAERADIAERYLSRIESGAAMPSIFVAFRIANAVGSGLDELTDFKAKPERAAVLALVRALKTRSDDEIERVIRVARAMFG